MTAQGRAAKAWRVVEDCVWCDEPGCKNPACGDEAPEVAWAA